MTYKSPNPHVSFFQASAKIWTAVVPDYVIKRATQRGPALALGNKSSARPMLPSAESLNSIDDLVLMHAPNQP